MKKVGLFSLAILIVLAFIYLPFGWIQPKQGSLVLACGNSGQGGQPWMGMANYEPTRVIIKEVVKEKGEEGGKQPDRDDQSLLVSTTKLVGNIVLFPFKLVTTVVDLVF